MRIIFLSADMQNYFEDSKIISKLNLWLSNCKSLKIVQLFFIFLFIIFQGILNKCPLLGIFLVAYSCFQVLCRNFRLFSCNKATNLHECQIIIYLLIYTRQSILKISFAAGT